MQTNPLPSVATKDPHGRLYADARRPESGRKSLSSAHDEVNDGIEELEEETMDYANSAPLLLLPFFVFFCQPMFLMTSQDCANRENRRTNNRLTEKGRDSSDLNNGESENQTETRAKRQRGNKKYLDPNCLCKMGKIAEKEHTMLEDVSERRSAVDRKS